MTAPMLPRAPDEGGGDGWAAPWAAAERVLCVRLDAMGDVLMTTPALRALKAARPSRHLTLLTSPAGAAVAALVPEVDDVIAYDAPWLKATLPRADAAPDLAMVERVRAGRYDAAVIFTVYSQNPLPSALFCHLAGIPRRLAHCRENPYQLLTSWVPEREPDHLARHEVERQLALVAAVGCPCPADDRLSLRVPADAVRRARERLAALGVDATRPWITLHPGATAPSRRYPPECFAAAARALRDGHGVQIVVIGAAADAAAVAAVRDGMGGRVAALVGGELAELAALVALAPVVVTNNSGPAHLAAAVGTPVVDLYALTNPQHTPWRVPARVLSRDVPCKYCYKSVCPEGHHACLRGVSPDAVAEAALDLLARPRPTGRLPWPRTSFAPPRAT